MVRLYIGIILALSYAFLVAIPPAYDSSSSSIRVSTRHACEMPSCYKSYVRLTSLQRHIREKHESSCVKCSVCGKKLLRLENLRGHILRRHTPRTPDVRTRLTYILN
jgi:uncharacterized Zn-finger protein